MGVLVTPPSAEQSRRSIREALATPPPTKAGLADCGFSGEQWSVGDEPCCGRICFRVFVFVFFLTRQGLGGVVEGAQGAQGTLKCCFDFSRSGRNLVVFYFPRGIF